MNNHVVKFLTVSMLAILSLNVHAASFGKPIITALPQKEAKANKYSRMLKSPATPKKSVALMNIQLNPEEKAKLLSYTPKSTKAKQGMFSHGYLPPAVNLGMNNVPVLDQGMHGSCVTFAITAAIDAIIGEGDYVSQLCSLELGSYLEEFSFIPSGWDGSDGPSVIDQIIRFGIVNKENQKAGACAGVTDYPAPYAINTGIPLPVDEFSQLSEDISEKIFPVYLLNYMQRFEEAFNVGEQMNDVLFKVKQTLHSGHRVAFGTFVVVTPYCGPGACAQYQNEHDTWALTKEIETPPFSLAGHEMIIYGYDDFAEAVDSEGNKHQGLFIIRNSWGPEAGDDGDYYMTYDYFLKFVLSVEAIHSA